ncbi:UDP-glucose/GDP-mannose dehydrogenase family protein [Thiotrichales bacterium 19S9-12]|nr:UDP-glucose/GDP-mannose dehydrogenase family protein [Thiotrichales bacterium 19S9-11]MCF6812058.1 UDP-glucose/GDP-mannose dehydrogenase family protein [Thiotrichales bacterium 19S9-12]
MKITIFGSGYVGLVTGTCFAEVGNHVTLVDINKDRVNILREGKCPIFEPGLESLIQKNIRANRLMFEYDAKDAIESAEVVFIAVGTPPEEDGSADLQYVLNVAATIGEHLNSYKVIVNKSTVPVGTADKVISAIQKQLDNRKSDIDFDVVSNPEFLKEGAAINDCMHPDRIIVGVNSNKAEKLIRNLYQPFNRNHDKVITMDIRSAELTKYAANSMLATKISFMNEMSQIAEAVGADIESVRIGIGSDKRIGYHFIYPGCGYGGSCFPKDVQALRYTAYSNQYQSRVLDAVHAVNQDQKQVLFNKIENYFNGDLKGKQIAVWGLAFKPNTDDIREAPSRDLVEKLFKAGAYVHAYDPEAMDNFKNIYHDKSITFCASAEAALDNADALVVVTEWLNFRSPDFQLIKDKLTCPVIFDGRNLYDPAYLKSLDIDYISIGRVFEKQH